MWKHSVKEPKVSAADQFTLNQTKCRYEVNLCGDKLAQIKVEVESINQSINQSIIQSISQSVIQSINQIFIVIYCTNKVVQQKLNCVAPGSHDTKTHTVFKYINLELKLWLMKAHEVQ